MQWSAAYLIGVVISSEGEMQTRKGGAWISPPVSVTYKSHRRVKMKSEVKLINERRKEILKLGVREYLCYCLKWNPRSALL